MKINFSQKGFNMFSAIVAVVLIMTVSVLVGTLVMSEERTSTQIYGMLNNYKLADAANIARADALQSFNYAFREKMEDYLTYNESELKNEIGMGLFEIRSDSEEISFDQIQKKFEENILLNSNTTDYNGNQQQFSSVLDYVAENTVENFSPWTYGKYAVELNDSSVNARKTLYNALTIALNKSHSDGKNFLEIVDCSESSCPKGSFYFNVPLSKLTDEEYELIPRIVVKDTFTQEQIKMAILPKTDIKVYIPIRFFKVLYEAMDVAKGIKLAHEQNSVFRLGFCDGVCQPRDNPFRAPSSSEWNRDCPTSSEQKWIVTLQQSVAGINSYFSGGDSVGSTGLWGYGAEEVCAKSISSNAFSVEDDAENFFVYNKDLALGVQRKEVISNCGYYYLAIGATPEVTGTINDGSGQKLYCGKITNLAVDIVFVDTNPNFLVKGTSITNGINSNKYKIRVSDISFDPAISEDDANPSFSCNTGLGYCKPA
jgi:hypothetical protein